MDYLQYGLQFNWWASPVNTVLNLIINGLPSILPICKNTTKENEVLNLIINGLPSILKNASFNALNAFTF